MSSATLAVVRTLKDSLGRYLWQPDLGGAVDATDGTLAGKAVVIDEQMPAANSGNG
jgi:HK97 family phage major capsid protein